MRRFTLPLIVGALLFVSTGSAAAQGLIRLGVGGGLTLPVSDLADLTEQGLHGQVMLGVNVPLFPISARIDAAYHHLPTVGEGHLRQFAITANARVSSIGLPVSPYLIAGIGVYNSRFSEGAAVPELELGTEAQTDFGINAGAGLLLRFGILQAFVEARYHHIFNDAALQHVPITVGVQF